MYFWKPGWVGSSQTLLIKIHIFSSAQTMRVGIDWHFRREGKGRARASMWCEEMLKDKHAAAKTKKGKSVHCCPQPAEAWGQPVWSSGDSATARWHFEQNSPPAPPHPTPIQVCLSGVYVWETGKEGWILVSFLRMWLRMGSRLSIAGINKIYFTQLPKFHCLYKSKQHIKTHTWISKHGWNKLIYSARSWSASVVFPKSPNTKINGCINYIKFYLSSCQHILFSPGDLS